MGGTEGGRKRKGGREKKQEEREAGTRKEAHIGDDKEEGGAGKGPKERC